MLEMKEGWERMSEKEILRYEEKLQYLKKKKKTKSQKKLAELLRECKKTLCTLLGDWKLTRCQEEEQLEMQMRRNILETRGVRRPTEDDEEVTKNEPAAAIDDLGTSAHDITEENDQVLKVEDVTNVEDDNVTEKTAKT